MQIDRHNLHQHIDRILEDIKAAHFVAFDCEFTGLVTQNEHMEGDFADHREFYERIKETALNFNLLQLGITAYIFEDGHYHPKPYNIRVSAHPRAGYNQLIVAEWDSLSFLARNGMHFGKTFRDGIEPKRINPQKRPRDTQYRHPVAQRPQTFYAEEDRKVIKRIEAQLKGAKKGLRVDFENRVVLDYIRNTYDIAVDKPKKNMGRWEYEVKIYSPIGIDAMEDVVFEKQPEKQLAKEDINFLEKDEHGPPGLESIISCIIEHKKPIVGFFPNLDLGLIYQAFIDDMPESY